MTRGAQAGRQTSLGEHLSHKMNLYPLWGKAAYACVRVSKYADFTYLVS